MIRKKCRKIKRFRWINVILGLQTFLNSVTKRITQIPNQKSMLLILMAKSKSIKRNLMSAKA